MGVRINRGLFCRTLRRCGKFKDIHKVHYEHERQFFPSQMNGAFYVLETDSVVYILKKILFKY